MIIILGKSPDLATAASNRFLAKEQRSSSLLKGLIAGYFQT
jgi:hypothetical protein